MSYFNQHIIYIIIIFSLGCNTKSSDINQKSSNSKMLLEENQINVRKTANSFLLCLYQGKGKMNELITGEEKNNKVLMHAFIFAKSRSIFRQEFLNILDEDGWRLFALIYPIANHNLDDDLCVRCGPIIMESGIAYAWSPCNRIWLQLIKNNEQWKINADDYVAHYDDVAETTIFFQRGAIAFNEAAIKIKSKGKDIDLDQLKRKINTKIISGKDAQ